MAYDRCGILWFMFTNKHFRQSFMIALPCAIISVFLETAENYLLPEMFTEQGIFFGNDSYAMLTTLVGFTVIFRTQNAYGRYWEGVDIVYEISGDFYDAASSLMAMCSRSKDQQMKVRIFKHKIVRLFSLLNALIYDELEDVSENRKKSRRGFAVCELPLIDPSGIDETTLSVLNRVENKVETTFQWIQLLVVENMRDCVIDVPAPILTRVFQEMGAGMLKFHGALKLANIPFPLPYSATTHVLICMHWVISPMAVCHAVKSSTWAFVFSFLPVFTIWALDGIAGELENPFCHGCSGVHLGPKHLRQNHRLLSLLRKDLCRLPELSSHANMDEESLCGSTKLRLSKHPGNSSGTRTSLEFALHGHHGEPSTTGPSLNGSDDVQYMASSGDETHDQVAYGRSLRSQTQTSHEEVVDPSQLLQSPVSPSVSFSKSVPSMANRKDDTQELHMNSIKHSLLKCPISPNLRCENPMLNQAPGGASNSHSSDSLDGPTKTSSAEASLLIFD